MINLIIISILGICQGCIQICDFSYLLYQTNRIHLSLWDFQTLRLLLQFPWLLITLFIRIIKPLWGFLSDMVPIAEQRRKPYLIIFSFLTFTLFNFMAILDFDKKTAFAIIFLIGISIVICNVVTEAILVELSERKQSSGNIALFFGMRALGGLIFNLLMAYSPFHKNNFQVLSIFPLIMICTTLFYREQTPTKLMNPKQAITQILHFLKQPIIYRPILFIFFFMATPSPSTSMFYFYVNQLGLNDEFFSTLRFTYNLCSIAAVFVYFLVRKASFQRILSISNILYFIASLSSLILVTRINIEYNISDHQFCMVDNIIMQTLQEINTLPVLALAGTMCPSQIEGTIYSILMAAVNLGNAISREFGIVLTYQLGITNEDFTKLWLLILICNVASQIPMPFIGTVDEDAMKQRKHKLLKEEKLC